MQGYKNIGSEQFPARVCSKCYSIIERLLQRHLSWKIVAQIDAHNWVLLPSIRDRRFTHIRERVNRDGKVKKRQVCE